MDCKRQSPVLCPQVSADRMARKEVRQGISALFLPQGRVECTRWLHSLGIMSLYSTSRSKATTGRVALNPPRQEQNEGPL